MVILLVSSEGPLSIIGLYVELKSNVLLAIYKPSALLDAAVQDEHW
jgi:hypothetical protein